MKLELHPHAFLSPPPTVRDAFDGALDDGTGGRIGPRSQLTEWMKNIPAGGSCFRGGARQSYGGANFATIRLEWDRPGLTLLKNDTKFWHPVHHRPITLAEAKRIASFPDAFSFPNVPTPVAVRAAWSRIGNSVPPLFARALALHLRRVLGR
jgi:DNA (cytosine-5)-methyltransferase 1